MCGISGAFHLGEERIPDLRERLDAMSALQRHRGPDGSGIWTHREGFGGFAHRRLSVIDLETGQQPMQDRRGNWITFNGEIYNYRELREELGRETFDTRSDTEVILQAYARWGADCLPRFRGMFAFALWDESSRTLFCARDRFGIKPLYYTIVRHTGGDVLYLASEPKALLPFVDEIETDIEAFKEYLCFQFCLGGKTLFNGIRQLEPGHFLTVRNGRVAVQRYWEVYFQVDFDHTSRYFEEKVKDLLEDSVLYHLRSDVPVGCYVSGGIDSGVVASLAARGQSGPVHAFTGGFRAGPDYDETSYARDLAARSGLELHEAEIGADQFVERMEDIIYHLDYPVAGPGAFPQYVVADLARRHRKVVLGGQGGDEIFGGYARYLIAYFEQCIKGAIDGTLHNGNFVVTYESIIPNLSALRAYKPLLQEFWREGLFEDMDRRYFRLINRSRNLGSEIRWPLLGDYSPYETFAELFNGDNVGSGSYLDKMTHFDFKTLLPALLHVEDRMSMAHGLESRVPFLDHPVVELAASIPSDVKFKDGRMKHVLKAAVSRLLPESILGRTDKMGFPVPLAEWLRERGCVRDFVLDVLSSQRARERELVDNDEVVRGLERETRFGRKVWGFLCLELWHRQFHDRKPFFRNRLRSSLRRECAT